MTQQAGPAFGGLGLAGLNPPWCDEVLQQSPSLGRRLPVSLNIYIREAVSIHDPVDASVISKDQVPIHNSGIGFMPALFNVARCDQ